MGTRTEENGVKHPRSYYLFNVHHLIFSREKKRKREKEKRQKGLTFSQSRSQMTCKIKKKENAFLVKGLRYGYCFLVVLLVKKKKF